MLHSLMQDPLAIFAPSNRKKVLVVAGVLAAAIALVDWWTTPYVSLGFLYLFPIMMAGGFLSRKVIIVMALLCAVLDFANLPKNDTPVHVVFSFAGFVGTGLFISELVRNRYLALQHYEYELRGQIKQRQEAEEQLNVLVDSSPAAIVIVGLDGKILLCNEAAQRLLAPEATAARPIHRHLPACLAWRGSDTIFHGISNGNAMHRTTT